MSVRDLLDHPVVDRETGEAGVIVQIWEPNGEVCIFWYDSDHCTWCHSPERTSVYDLVNKPEEPDAWADELVLT